MMTTLGDMTVREFVAACGGIRRYAAVPYVQPVRPPGKRDDFWSGLRRTLLPGGGPSRVFDQNFISPAIYHATRMVRAIRGLGVPKVPVATRAEVRAAAPLVHPATLAQIQSQPHVFRSTGGIAAPRPTFKGRLSRRISAWDALRHY